jgi:hypothetical protein
MGTDADQRQRAAMLLKERHERESETPAELMAAIARRAIAEDVVRTESERIVSRLAEMSRLGFDDELQDSGEAGRHRSSCPRCRAASTT